MERGLHSIFHRQRGPYAFYEANLVGEGDGTMRDAVDVFEVIATSLRGDVPKDAMTRVIRRLGTERQRIKKGAPLARFSLQSNEKAFVELMGAEPATAAILIEQFGDPKVAKRMIYLLAITESLEVYRPVSRPAKKLSGEIVAPRKMPPEPPAGLTEEHLKRWEEVSRVTGMMDRQNYFEMLGVKESADANEVRIKYMELAKKWHPDRLPKELSDLRSWVEEIFHLLTVARETLGNQKCRAEYQKTVMQGGGTPESERKLHVMVEAAINFQKVNVLLKLRRYDEALQICNQAMEVVRKEADYPAMKAWILLVNQGIEDDEVADEIRALLKTTFQLNTDHVHGHFVRAHFLKRMGDHDKALKHFKKVAELDPKNLEAVREVRIAAMRLARGRSSAPPPANSGKRPSMFVKFFKR